MRSSFLFFCLTSLVFVATAACSNKAFAVDGQSYELIYQITLNAGKNRADVEIQLVHNEQVSEIDFNLGHSNCTGFSSEDAFEQKGTRLIWRPNSNQSELGYHCSITHARPSSQSRTYYDALITDDWAIFRGDDMVPSARVTAKKGAYSKARLHFDLPDNWSVNTGWQRDLSITPQEGKNNANEFIIDNPERNFDRPTGWIIAGDLGTRRLKLEQNNRVSRIAVSAPKDSSMRRMDILTFITIVWPEFEAAFGHTPEKLLIVGADDPMWRGGLSASNSFYMHADRPIVSENGTSSLLHEIFHMSTGIRGENNNDWIAEGLAEYYSIELLRRAGGLSDDRLQRTKAALANWSRNISTLEAENSRGATTAAAVLLLFDVAGELQAYDKTLDDVVKELMPLGRVDKQDLSDIFIQLTGETSITLRKSPLLNWP